MKNTPIERNVIDETINEFQIVDFSKATIREVKAIASKAEAVSGVEFIKMEMGVPGLPASAVGVKAEIEALQNGIARRDAYPLPALCREHSLRSLLAASAMKRKTRSCLSIRDFPYRNSSW